ncbi:hypothetical protein JQ633_12475 [Bradyrhizobium tropiciagri]|uniref:hypothetical protein n=1 Tax=Bradyrhizobium tropiciagri TaxID=312253 RepID=UPI001BA51BDE|nr:hypothetical protein [Bradyrhizobium tropiciagri]MBR0871178.1 hypothetical protein [Bradyrhizobium tropiciagri]
MQPPATHTIYEILKDFQPALAALIALAAAGIAYLGATHKARSDAKIALREHQRAMLGDRLRLRYEVGRIMLALKHLEESADKVQLVLQNPNRSPVDEAVIKLYETELDTTPELDCAWNKLQNYSEETANDIDLLRRRLFAIKLGLRVDFASFSTTPDEAAKFAVDGREPAQRLLQTLSREIRKMHS